MSSRLVMVLSMVLASCLAPEQPAQGAEVRADRAMVIDGVIQGTNLNAIRSALLSKKFGDEVDLVIDSPGGSVGTGFDFVSVMEDTKARGVLIRCYVGRMAASMAFQILLHCDEKHVLDRSMLLWHRARIMGGLGGGPMTAPQLEVLSRSLQSMDTLIFSECMKYIYMDRDSLSYHFENETFHVGQQLADSTGSFQSHAAIPGLYEALANTSIPRTTARESFFGDIVPSIPAGPVTPTTPWRTDLDVFAPGEIIYIK